MANYSISWSPKSRLTYYKILEYLIEEWTIKELEAFIDRTEEVISHISDNPLLYPYSRDGDAHKCVVVRQVSLFYRVRTDTVELLVFWDNRQDPGRIRLWHFYNHPGKMETNFKTIKGHQ